MNFKKLLSVILAVAMIIGAMGTVSANNTGVAEINGVGYASLAEALNAAAAGDTVLLKANPDSSATITKAITLKGVDTSNGQVAFGNYNPVAIAGGIDGEVVIENIAFRGTTNQSLYLSGGDYKKTTVKIKDCYFEYSQNRGIQFASELKELYITGCTFDTKATSYLKDYIIWMNPTCPSKLVIDSNEFLGNGYVRGAVHTGENGPADAEIIISNNTASNLERVVQVANSNDVNITVKDNECTDIAKLENSPSTEDQCAVVFIHKVASSAVNLDIKGNVATDSKAVVYSENTEDVSKFIGDYESNKLGDKFYDENGVELKAVAKIGNKEYTSLKYALENAVAGDNVIELLPGVIDEDIIIHQTEGVNITIKGDGATTKFAGHIEVYGHARHNGAETLTFDGVAFETNEKDHVFIEQTEKTGNATSLAKCYPHNITVQNCAFTATGDAVNTAAGMKYRYGYNITVKATTSTNMHSLMQNYAGVGLTVEDVTITGKNGIALGTSQNVKISGADITATGYGLRVDAQIDTKIEIADCDIEAFIPVVVRKAEKAVEIEFNGDNEMTATNTDGIWCAIGTSEYEENGKLPAAPAGTITIDINDDGLTGTGVYGVVAVSGSDVYTTLAEAFAAAENGDTITLMSNVELPAAIVTEADDNIILDLNGKNISVAYESTGKHYYAINNYGTLTIKDTVGTGKISARGLYNRTAGSVMTLNGVDVEAIDTNGGACVWNLGTLTVEDATFTVPNTGNAVAVNSQPGSGKTSLKNITVDAEKSTAYAIQGFGDEFVIEDAFVKGGHGAVYVGGSADVTIDGGSYICTGAEGITDNCIYVDNDKASLTIKDGTFVGDSDIAAGGSVVASHYGADVQILGGNFSGGSREDIEGEGIVISGGEYSIKPYDKFIKAGHFIMPLANGDYAVVSEKATAGALSVKFRDVTEDGEREKKVYEIVLEAESEEQKIHEFASADLTFDINVAPYESTAKMYKDIKPAKGMTMTDVGDGRYAFNCDGVTKYEVTDNEVVLGTITISGFGKYSIAVKDLSATTNDTNVVHATALFDNLVESFVPNGDADNNYLTGKLVINTNQADSDKLFGSIGETELKVPTQKLTVNVKFPNAIEDNDALYQQMKVTVVGGKVDTFADLGEFGTGMNSYSVDFIVPYNAKYTVEVTGAGYRTARYSVEVRGEDKVLNFWNNVMSPAHKEEIEAGNGNKVAWNFLAGDIVADNHINIYDLSAVVSYFGEINLSKDNKPEYAKYDLNRDGTIDSKDVAYVLVSWHE